MKNLYKSLVLLSFIFVQACGGSSGGGDSGGDVPNLDVSGRGEQVNMTFDFQAKLSNGTDPVMESPLIQELTVPIYIQPNGIVSLAAQEFPPVVVRVCGASGPDCNVVTSEIEKSLKVDLVIDSCSDGLTDNKCGAKDTKFFTGVMSRNGAMTINAVAIRIRIFAQGDGAPEGKNALPTDGGTFQDLPRIVATLTTGPGKVGVLNETGSLISDSAVKLVSAGVIPTGIPGLEGFAYLSIVNGTFDQDPLALIQ